MRLETCHQFQVFKGFSWSFLISLNSQSKVVWQLMKQLTYSFIGDSKLVLIWLQLREILLKREKVCKHSEHDYSQTFPKWLYFSRIRKAFSEILLVSRSLTLKCKTVVFEIYKNSGLCPRSVVLNMSEWDFWNIEIYRKFKFRGSSIEEQMIIRVLT